ncbi:unnamed protein product [Symbiodinium natans]|uniref:YchJ-like middle NTF2-like domain-containing protein n=1 Tax=Symbiodinium natans TaxID=878477 RepID=A0A812V0Y8_9DINO|nr:unnamed protein product [Symbiodinium natans]
MRKRSLQQECRGRWWHRLVVSSVFIGFFPGRFCWAPSLSFDRRLRGFRGFRTSSKAKGFGAETAKPQTKNVNCPCLSGLQYKACCRRLHKDLTAAATPEQMAKARFSALALRKYDYLLDTTHPTHVDFQEDRAAWKKQMARNNRGFRYVGLNVTSSEERGEDLHAVTIEAAAEPEKVSGVPKVLLIQECSVYRREGQTWKYAAAEGLKREVVEGAGSAQQLAGM